MPQRSRLITAAVILAIASACTFLRDGFHPSLHHTALTLFLPFIGYYICGYELKIAETSRRNHVTAVAVTLAAVLVTMFTARWLVVGELGRHLLGWWYGAFGPTVIVMSIGIFMLAHGIDPVRLRLAAKLSPATFGVYVLHPVFIPFIVKTSDSLHLIPAVAIPVIALAVFAWSLITVLALMRIPYLRRLFA